MTDGQFIERATLDLWAETQQEQRDTITAMRAQIAEVNHMLSLSKLTTEAVLARAERAEAALAIQPSPDVAELVALLAEARTDLAAYVDAAWPEHQRSFFPVVQEKWKRDMVLCWQIDAALARVKGGDA